MSGREVAMASSLHRAALGPERTPSVPGCEVAIRYHEVCLQADGTNHVNMGNAYARMDRTTSFITEYYVANIPIQFRGFCKGQVCKDRCDLFKFQTFFSIL